MAVDDQEIRLMARSVAEAMAARTGRKVKHLKVVRNDDEDRLNAIQRDILYSRISDLTTQYNLGWLVRQDTMKHLGLIECLPDHELQKLVDRLEIAVDCIHEGVPFVERGLIHGVTCNWVA